MKLPAAASAALALALVACEQESQPLPFSAEMDGPTVRVLSPAEAGSVTSTAGATVHFPAGALRDEAEITIAPTAAPSAVWKSGAPASRGFQVTPEGLELAQPARVEIRVDRGVEESRSWLASLIVSRTDGVEEVGETRLDLRSGLAEAAISRLGTLAVVIPDPEAVFTSGAAGPSSALAPNPTTLLPTGTDSVVAACGGVASRCEGVAITASNNLWEMVSKIAAIYPRVTGTLRIDGEAASGEIVFNTSVRLLLKSGATAENVRIRGLLRPTAATRVSEDASAIVLTNALVRMSGGTGAASQDLIGTVTVEKAGDRGYAKFSRGFELGGMLAQNGNATVAITVPLQIHQ